MLCQAHRPTAALQEMGYTPLLDVKQDQEEMTIWGHGGLSVYVPTGCDVRFSVLSSACLWLTQGNLCEGLLCTAVERTWVPP